MPVVIAATATANRLIWAIVFKLVTDDLFLIHIRSCPVFLKRELYLSHSVRREQLLLKYLLSLSKESLKSSGMVMYFVQPRCFLPL